MTKISLGGFQCRHSVLLTLKVISLLFLPLPFGGCDLFCYSSVPHHMWTQDLTPESTKSLNCKCTARPFVGMWYGFCWLTPYLAVFVIYIVIKCKTKVIRERQGPKYKHREGMHISNLCRYVLKTLEESYKNHVEGARGSMARHIKLPSGWGSPVI